MKKLDFDWLSEKLPQFGVKVFFTILILFIGFWLSGVLKRILKNRMTRRGVEPSIREFLIPIFDVAFKILIIITAISTMGIEVTSFSAVMLGLAAGVGMSLQGSLSNFAGGLLIIFFKPFKVGDYIESQGNGGTVESISILYTCMVTVNQQVVVLPNASLLNNPIKNYSVKPIRLIDIKIGISYNEDFKKTNELLLNLLKSDPDILKEKEIKVEITELTDKQIILMVRGFVKSEEYWTVFYRIQQNILEILQKNEIDLSHLPDKPVVSDKFTNNEVQ